MSLTSKKKKKKKKEAEKHIGDHYLLTEIWVYTCQRQINHTQHTKNTI